jgi:hypothetical protein
MTRFMLFLLLSLTLSTLAPASHGAPDDAPLPNGVSAVWDMKRAPAETMPTRERICLNGLWRWRPATGDSESVPSGGWGFFKVPGPWPGITDYLEKDCQTVYPHPSWKDLNLSDVTAAWYQREIAIPADWKGRRIALSTSYLNSLAVVYADGRRVGEMKFPGGEVDLTDACRPGTTHRLSLYVEALPLK